MATREVINNGTTANDGTGDTLREAASKINSNFAALFESVSGDSATFNQTVTFGTNTITFEGTTADDFETTLTVVDPTQDNTITLPDSSGQVVLRDTVDVLTNKTINHMNVNGRLCFGDSENSVSQYFINAGNLQADYDVNLPVITANDTFTFDNAASTLKNKTLNAPIMHSPRLGANILDSAGSEIITITKAGSAVNQINIRNAATGSAPSIRADGDDTNVNLELYGQGTGGISFESRPIFEKGTDVTSTTAIDLNDPATVFNSGSQIDPTIAAGVTGQIKNLVNVGAGSVHLYGATSGILGNADSNGGFLDLPQNKGCQVMYVNSKWYLIGNNGVSGA